MSTVQIFVIKIWRITTANALAITGGLSLLNFAEGHVYINAVILTVVSMAVFYYASYRDFGELVLPSTGAPQKPWSWRVFFYRIWKITLGNALWIFAGLTYIFFVVGISMVYLTLLTMSGFVMLYIDAYRTMEEEADAENSTEEADAENSTEEADAENTTGTVGE